MTHENLKSLNLLIEVMVTISIDGNIYWIEDCFGW